MKKILIVDDSDGILKMYTKGIKIILDRLGISLNNDLIFMFKSFSEFKKKNGNQYDVAIIDWMLEKNETGDMVIKYLKEKNLCKNIFIVSGFASNPKLQSYANENKIKVYQKPFSLEELQEIIEQYIFKDNYEKE